MPSLKTLRLRIKSVKNTRQITKTMKMVAAAKVRRARAAVESARPYAARLGAILSNIAANASGDAPLLLTGRAQVKTVRLIVCGSDRGLCGGLNSNLLKKANNVFNAYQKIGIKVEFVAVGRKIRDALKSSHPQFLVASYVDMGRAVEFSHAQKIAQESLETFESGICDKVEIISAELISMLTQTPKLTNLIPFIVESPLSGDGMLKTSVDGIIPSERGEKKLEQVNSFEFEPSEAEVLADLLPRNLNLQVFSALLETQASEQAARMAAMDSATRNAGEMIKKLSVQYNRSRQAAITKELIEIISGAEAV